MNVSIKDKPVVTAERPGRGYIADGEICLIVQDGVYVGWYNPNKDDDK